MALLYSVRDWDLHFEKAQGRKIAGAMTWVPIPTKHDGKRFRRLIGRTDGPTIFCAWILIVQIAAKCDQRGVLRDADGPLTPSDMAIQTGAPVELFSNSLKVLCSKEIGWIVGTPLLDGWEETGSDVSTQDKQNKQDNSCGDDATVTASATGSEDGEQATSKANGQGFPELFELFWQAYPTRGGRKRGKSKCLGMWRQAIRESERQPLVEAAKNYAASDESTRGYARDPERFLAKEWWRDWVPSIASEPVRHVAPAVPPRVAPVNFKRAAEASP